MTPNEVSLREYVESRFAAAHHELQEFKEYHRREHSMLQGNLDSAKADMIERLQASFVTKSEHSDVEARIASLERFTNRFWGVILAAMFLSGFISYLVEKAMGK